MALVISAVHLQDITRVHDSKSDMRDGLVNWSKMRQIGKYASVVTHCSRLTPHYPHDERLSQLVMDAPVFSLDDDDDVSVTHSHDDFIPTSHFNLADFVRTFVHL